MSHMRGICQAPDVQFCLLAAYFLCRLVDYSCPLLRTLVQYLLIPILSDWQIFYWLIITCCTVYVIMYALTWTSETVILVRLEYEIAKRIWMYSYEWVTNECKLSKRNTWRIERLVARKLLWTKWASRWALAGSHAGHWSGGRRRGSGSGSGGRGRRRQRAPGERQPMRLALGPVDELRERLERDGQVVVEHHAVERPRDARLEPLRLELLLTRQPLDQLLVLRSSIIDHWSLIIHTLIQLEHSGINLYSYTYSGEQR